MKIVIVHNFYQRSGGEDVVFDQERELLKRKGHEVIVYTRSNHELAHESLLDRVGNLQRTIWARDSRREIERLLHKEKPDIVHIHNTLMMISPSIYGACVDAGVPTVQTLHNFRLLCPVSTLSRDGKVCTECIDHGLLAGVRHACYRNSRTATAAVAMMLAIHRVRGTWRNEISAYIALTKFAKRLFVENGLPAEKIYVKPNFVDPDPGERKAPGDYACFLGRLSPEKGVSTLLEAWKLLEHPIPLKIAGDGPLREELESQARRLGLDQVEFLGTQTRTAANDLLKAARFTVVPSIWYEGFAVVMVESFACGVPILASRLGAMEELIEHGRTGFHFNPGDPADLARWAQWAWDHPDEVVAMGHRAREEYCAKYTAEPNYDILMNIYQNAIAGSRSQAVSASCSAPERQFGEL